MLLPDSSEAHAGTRAWLSAHRAATEMCRSLEHARLALMKKSLADYDWTQWRGQDLATLVFVIRDGRILLIRKKRGLGAGKINGPGGKFEPGETALECAVREVQEELCITPTGLVDWGENKFQFADGYAIHVHVLKARDFSGEPQETEEAIPIWYDLDAIPDDEMPEDDDLWLPLVIEGRRFRGRFVFDDDVMLDYALEIEDETRSDGTTG